MEKTEKTEKQIWEYAQKEFSLDSTPYHKLGSFESEIWEVYQKGFPYILRITDLSHRTLDELQSEIEWIQYLHEKKITVANIVTSVSGEKCLKTEHPPCYLMLFTKAPGHGPLPEDLTEDLFVHWGSILGRMHYLSGKFRPSPHFIRTFTENILTSRWNKVSSQIDPVIAEQYFALQRQCSEFPVTHKHYGLIHSDFHMGNFFVDHGKITLFDFDDLQLGWFVYDIAMALYYMFWNADLKEPTWYQDSKARSEKAIYFLKHLLKGYRKEFSLYKGWNEMLPHFLYLRQLELYLVFVERFGQETDKESMPYILTQQYKGRLMNQITPIPLEVFELSHYER